MRCEIIWIAFSLGMIYVEESEIQLCSQLFSEAV